MWIFVINTIYNKKIIVLDSLKNIDLHFREGYKEELIYLSINLSIYLS